MTCPMMMSLGVYVLGAANPPNDGGLRPTCQAARNARQS